MKGARTYQSAHVAQGAKAETERRLPEEVPVALSFAGTTLAVMMASPCHLEEFALGFALSEGVINAADEIEEIEVVAHAGGYEARGWITAPREEALRARQRAMVGPVGCGLCGIDSIEAALAPLPPVDADVSFEAAEIAGALDSLRDQQPLQDATRAAHAAGFLVPGHGVTLVREDVGRHNALDKLIGALARAGIDPATGAIVLTSRLSIDLVQKVLRAGSGMVIAASAPTAQALDMARDGNLTVAGFAKNGQFDLFAHTARVSERTEDVA